MKLAYTDFSAILIITVLFFTSCNQFVEIPESKTQVESNIVFADSSLATSALLGAYYTLGNASTRMKNLSLYIDEYDYTSINNNLIQFKQSKLFKDNSDNLSIWQDLYSVIYQCNALIEGLNSTKTISASTSSSLKAEAKFMRAYSFMFLINIYDNVPLILTTDVNENRIAKQSTKENIYKQIITDLKEAKDNLSISYIGGEKVRANKFAVGSLLARAYLYQSRWSDANREANEVISSMLYSPLPKLEDVFIANSKETILQFWLPDGFIKDAQLLIPASTTTLPMFPITKSLYESYESHDERKVKWIASNDVLVDGVIKAFYYQTKYKNTGNNQNRKEYSMVLRLGEQYLIRAEALAQQGNVIDAIEDINVIRIRSGLSKLSNQLSKEECLTEVGNERRKELFGEWGNRFFDLKRSGRLDAVLAPLKATWKSDAKAFPIPNSEITINPNLIQNHGY